MYMGRQPIFIARNRNGEFNAFINACSHRGAMLCRHKKGNKATYTCPFHGWTFNNSGKLLKVKDPDGGGYPDSFNKDGSHDLTKVPRFESYRGFLFGSLNPDVKPLKEHLGEAAKIIDMIVDQSPEGLEVLRGSSSYIYDGNWKLQTENGADGYHVSAVIGTMPPPPASASRPRRSTPSAPWTQAAGPSRAAASTPSRTAICCCGPPGPTPRTGPTGIGARSWRRSSVRRRLTGWCSASRNLCLYPNVYLMDQFSSQIRTTGRSRSTRPRSRSTASRPRARAPKPGRRRIRQYEDFFNATGMATPDDLEEFRSCQIGYKGRSRAGTTSAAGPRTGSPGRTKPRRRSASSR